MVAGVLLSMSMVHSWRFVEYGSLSIAGGLLSMVHSWRFVEYGVR